MLIFRPLDYQNILILSLTAILILETISSLVSGELMVF